MVRNGLAASALLFAPALASAQQPPAATTAEQAVETQRKLVQAATSTAPCRPGMSGEDIVVCARRYGPPDEFPDPPGQRVRLQPGEANSGSQALAQTASSPCTTVGANSRCSGGLDVVRGARVLGKIGKHLLGRDD
jgi:hypothetical protein